MSEVNLQDALDALKGVQTENVYPIYIPSLKKNLMFKEMTTKQEKAIVKTIIDSPVYNSEFIFAIRNIIKENCADDFDIDSLTVIDKTAICLAMRLKSIGNTFEYTFKNTEKSTTVNVQDHIDIINTIEIPKDVIISNPNVKITCGYPTIKVEYDLEMEFRNNLDNLDITSLDDARNAIGDVYTNEIVKHIKDVTIITGGNEMVLNMNNYNFKSRLEILEQIGQSLTNEIVDYMKQCADVAKLPLSIELELDEDDKEKFKTDKLTAVFETGSDFFIY